MSISFLWCNRNSEFSSHEVPTSVSIVREFSICFLCLASVTSLSLAEKVYIITWVFYSVKLRPGPTGVYVIKPLIYLGDNKVQDLKKPQRLTFILGPLDVL